MKTVCLLVIHILVVVRLTSKDGTEELKEVRIAYIKYKTCKVIVSTTSLAHATWNKDHRQHVTMHFSFDGIQECRWSVSIYRFNMSTQLTSRLLFYEQQTSQWRSVWFLLWMLKPKAAWSWFICNAKKIWIWKTEMSGETIFALTLRS